MLTMSTLLQRRYLKMILSHLKKIITDVSAQFAHLKFRRFEYVTPPACDGLNSDILGHHTLAIVNPFLFPFAIEFALTGAIISYHMFNKIGLL